MALLNTNTRYLHDSIVEYAEALTATLPEPLSVCFFVNSGSEANELALRLAMAYTRRDRFHRHRPCLSRPYDGTDRHQPLQVQWTRRTRQSSPCTKSPKCPTAFVDACRGFDARAGEFYAQSVAEKIEAIQTRDRQLAAFFAEGIMGCGGQMRLPDDYLKHVYAMVRAAGGVCVADEVQTGFGRVGSHFWSFELSGVVPDIVTMGKPIANGHPLGAVVTRPDSRRRLRQWHGIFQYLRWQSGLLRHWSAKC